MSRTYIAYINIVEYIAKLSRRTWVNPFSPEFDTLTNLLLLFTSGDCRVESIVGEVAKLVRDAGGPVWGIERSEHLTQLLDAYVWAYHSELYAKTPITRAFARPVYTVKRIGTKRARLSV